MKLSNKYEPTEESIFDLEDAPGVEKSSSTIEDEGVDELKQAFKKSAGNVKNAAGEIPPKVKIIIAVVVVVVIAIVGVSAYFMMNQAPKEPLVSIDELEDFANNGSTEEEDPGNTEVVVEESLPEDKYTDEEKEKLRSVGFTGYDIETMQDNGEDPYEKYKEAKDQLIKTNEEVMFALRDYESPEFRRLLSKTYLGEKPFIGDPNSEIKEALSYDDYNTTYEKVEARGNVLYLKIKLPEQMGYMYYPVPLRIYNLAKDKGSIRVGISVEVTNTDRVVRELRLDERSF